MAASVNLGANAAVASLTNAIASTLNAVPAGGVILVVAAYATVADTLNQVADSAGNTYVILENIAGTALGVGVAYCENAIALPAASTITATFAGVVSSQIRAQYISGAQPIGSLDTSGHTAQGLAATSASSVATGGLAASLEVIVAVLACTVNTGTVSSLGSFTAAGANTSNAPNCRLFAQTVNARDSVAWAPTWVNAGNYITEALSFIAVAPYEWAPELPRPDRLIPAMVAEDERF